MDAVIIVLFTAGSYGVIAVPQQEKGKMIY